MTKKLRQDTRILVVDDEPTFRELLALSFRRKGYQVLEASSGREAFNIIQADPVDVVVSDIRMPNGDGVEFLDRARKELIETPVILLITGFSELTTEDAYNKGAEALFSKPLDRKNLEDTIERLLTPSEERWKDKIPQTNVELMVELQFRELATAIEASVVSLGRGGMFVALREGHYPNVNDTVAFKIVFGGTENSLSGSGIVRWIRVKESPDAPAGCGIEFTYLGEAERKQVLDFVNSKKPSAYIPIK